MASEHARLQIQYYWDLFKRYSSFLSIAYVNIRGFTMGIHVVKYLNTSVPDTFFCFTPNLKYMDKIFLHLVLKQISSWLVVVIFQCNIPNYFRFQQPVLDWHYSDAILGEMVSQITSLTIVYPTIYSGADQRKHQCSASLAFLRGIHRGPVNYQHKRPITRKMFPFDDVIMICMNMQIVT